MKDHTIAPIDSTAALARREKKNPRRCSRYSSLLLILAASFAVVVGGVIYQADPAAANAPQSAVERSWRKALNIGVYSYRVDVEQTVHPAQTLSNVGLSSYNERYYLEGELDRPQRALRLKLWQGGQQGIEMKIENGKAYGRSGTSAAWQPVDDFSNLFAPGGDLLSYLAGAEDIQAGESPLAPFTAYTFNINGRTFGQYVQQQLQAELQRTGELPPGVTLEASSLYDRMQGSGEIWLNTDGLPAHQSLRLVFPAQQEGGEWVEAQIVTDFSHWGEPPAGIWSKGLPGALRYLLSNPRWFLPGIQTATILGTLALVGLLAALLILKHRSRRVHATLVGVVIFSLVVTPLLQSQKVHAYAQNQTPEETGRAQRQPEQSREQAALDRAQNSLQAALAQKPFQKPLTQAAAEFSLPAEKQAAWQTETRQAPQAASDAATDTDGDGLPDVIELNQLGTDPTLVDSDSDDITDTLEVQGVTDPNGKLWYLNPLSADTNSDTRQDWAECPELLTGGTTCPDTDGDGTPDIWDYDDDNDGVPDAVDQSPAAAVGSGRNPQTLGIQPLISDTLNFQLENYTQNVPLLVDFTLRPQNPQHLWYTANVLDWPTNDRQGQLQRVFTTTFATNNANPSSKDFNGDLRVDPMLEIEIPYQPGRVGNLPVLPGVDLNTITATTPLTAWLDTAQINTLGLAVRQKDDAGTLLVYVPLQLVRDTTGDSPVAFTGRMMYLPTNADFGVTQNVRLSWTVTMLNDRCDIDSMPDSFADPDDPAQIIYKTDDNAVDKWCAGSTNWVESAEVIQTYYDSWYLTALSVREDHGVQVAIAAQNPAYTQANANYENNLWMLAKGLEYSFLPGRVLTTTGQRDLTVADIQARFDKDHNASATDLERWNIDRQALIVYTYALSDQSQLFTVPMTDSKQVLTQFPQTTPAVTLLFAREEHFRNTLLPVANGGVLTQSLAISLDPTTAPPMVLTALSWAPFRPDGSGGWEAYPIQDYWDSLQTGYTAVFAANSQYSQDTDLARAGRAMLAKSFYLSLYLGANRIVEINGTPLLAQGVAGPGAAAPATRGPTAVLDDEEAPASDEKVKTDEQIAADAEPESAMEDASAELEKAAEKKLKAMNEAAGSSAVVPFILVTQVLEVVGRLGEERTKGLEVSGDVVKALLPLILGSHGLPGAFGAGGLFILAGLGALQAGGVGGDVLDHLFNTIGHLMAIYEIKEAYGGVKKAFQTVHDAELAAKVVKEARGAGSIFSLVLKIVVSVAVFIFAMLAGAYRNADSIATAVASLVGSVAIAVLMFIISAIVPIGTIIVAILKLIDAVISLICGFFKDLSGPAATICSGIVKVIGKVIASLVYSDQPVVDLNHKDRLNIVGLDHLLVDPDLGMTVGNRIQISADVYTRLYRHWCNGFASCIYYAMLSPDQMPEASFRYRLTQDNKDSMQPGVGDMDEQWEDDRDQGVEWQWSVTQTATTGDLPVGSYPFEQAGLNQPIKLFLAEDYAVPVQRCTLVACWEGTLKDTLHTDLGQSIIFDVLPATLDNFYALVPFDANGNVTLGWDSGFPVQADADGDGLRSQAFGGPDPDDGVADTDGDGLSDAWEVQYRAQGFDPTKTDTDADGLNDYWEAFYHTNPARADSDSDGLKDGEEVFHYDAASGEWVGGWSFRYATDSSGNALRTLVGSDPNDADEDADNVPDVLEKTYGYNPHMPSQLKVLAITSQADPYVAPGETLHYTATVQNLVDRYADGLLDATFPLSLTSESVAPTPFELQPEVTATLSGTLQVSAAQASQAISLTNLAGANIIDKDAQVDGRVLWLHLDGDFKDASYHANNAVCETDGCPTFTPYGYSGQAITLTNDIYVNDDDSLHLEKFSLGMWIKPPGGNGQPLLAKLGYPWGVTYSLLLSLNSDNSVSFMDYLAPGFSQLTSGSKLTANQWSSLFVTYDGQAYNLYVNGQLEASGVTTATSMSLPMLLRFGPRSVSTTILMDEVELYGRALAAGEIADRVGGLLLHLNFETPQLSAGQSGPGDVSAFNRSMGWGGSQGQYAVATMKAPSDWPPGDTVPYQYYRSEIPAGPSLQSGGPDNRYALLNKSTYFWTPIDDSLDLGRGAGSFSFAAWLYPDSSKDSTDDLYQEWRAVLGSADSLQSPTRQYPTLYQQGNQLRVTFRDGSSALCDSGPTGGILTAQQWQHVAVTFDGPSSQFGFYVNGALVKTLASSSCQGKTPGKAQAGDKLWIGRDAPGAWVYFDTVDYGWIDKSTHYVGIDVSPAGSNPDTTGSFTRVFQGICTQGEIGCDIEQLYNLDGDTAHSFRLCELDSNGNCTYHKKNGKYKGTSSATLPMMPIQFYNGDYGLYYGTNPGNDMFGQKTDWGLTWWNMNIAEEWLACDNSDHIDIVCPFFKIGNNYFYGRLDDVQIYGHALSALEVGEIYTDLTRPLELAFDEPPGAQLFANADPLSPFAASCTAAICPLSGLPGRLNQAVSFDGQQDYLDVANADVLGLKGGSFTAMAWFNSAALGGSCSNGEVWCTRAILGTDEAASLQGLTLGIWGNLPRFDFSGGTAHNFNQVLQYNQWTHLAFVYDQQSNCMYAYVNGGSPDSYCGTPLSAFQGSGLVHVGRSQGGNYYQGLLDDLRIYNSALSAVQINAAMQEAPALNLHLDDALGTTSFSDASNNSYTAACSGTGCPQAGAKGWMRAAPAFDGQDDYLTLPAALTQDISQNSFTVLAWVKGSHFPLGCLYPDQCDASIFGNDVVGANDTTLHLAVRMGKPYLGFMNDDLASNTGLNPNTWYHLGFRFDANTLQQSIFINGSLDITRTAAVSLTTPNPLLVGRARGGHYFGGQIDELQVYGVALADAQINDLYAYQASWYDVSAAANVVVDADRPQVSLGSSEVYLPGQETLLMIAAHDATSGIDRVEYEVDSSGWQPATRDRGAFIFPFNSGGALAAGVHKVGLRAYDLAGNQSDSVIAPVYVDLQPPQVTLNTAAVINATYLEAENRWVATLNGKASDDAALSHLVVTLIDASGATAGPPQRIALSGTRATWTASYTFAYPPNTAFQAAIQVYDQAGNLSQYPQNAASMRIPALPGDPQQPDNLSGSVRVDGDAPWADLTSTGGVSATVIAGSNTVISGTAYEVPYAPLPSLLLHFEEPPGSLAFNDASFFHYAAQCAGASCPALTSSPYGQAADFSGGDHHLSIASSPALTQSIGTLSGELSAMAWVKLHNLTGVQHILSYTDTLYSGGFSLDVLFGNLALVGFGGEVYVANNQVLPANSWVHVGVVMDAASGVSFYMNGKPFQVITVTQPLKTTASGTLQIGAGLDGALDELALYSRPLSADQVQSIANAAALGLQRVQVGFLHLGDIFNEDSMPWQDAVLAQPGTIFSTWSYTVPQTLNGQPFEGPYSLYLRAMDSYGHQRVLPSVWFGEVDTAAPRVTLFLKYDQVQNTATYNCTVQDYNLSTDNFSCAGLSASSFTPGYITATWYTTYYSNTNKLYQLSSPQGFNGMPVNDAATACDLYGNCTTNTNPQPPSQAARQSGKEAILAPVNVELQKAVSPAAEQAAVQSYLFTPTNQGVAASLDPLALSGFASAPDGLKALDVTANGAVVYHQDWAPGEAVTAAWTTSWTPPADGVYALQALVTDANSQTALSSTAPPGRPPQPVIFYVDTTPPQVTLDTSRVDAANFHAGHLHLSGSYVEPVAVAALEARLDGGDWQALSLQGLSGGAWQGDLYTGRSVLPEDETWTVEVRLRDVGGHTATDSRQLPANAAAPRPPAAYQLRYTSSQGGQPLVKPGATISDTLNPALIFAWTPGSSPDVAGYTLEWLQQVGQGRVVLRTTAIGPGGPFTDSLAAGETQELYVHLAARDAHDNTSSWLYGPYFVDYHTTPVLAALFAGGKENPTAYDLYHNWLEEPCNQLGVDNRMTDKASRLAALRDPQKFYAAWDAQGLRLAWSGANWNRDGDLFIYLDTKPGGSDRLYNPYPVSANTVILLPSYKKADGSTGQSHADAMIWVQDAATAGLYLWANNHWQLTAGLQYTLDTQRAAPLTELYLPFSALGIADPAANPLALLAVAAEPDVLRLWASMPRANALNSSLVMDQPVLGSQVYLLTQYYLWETLGSGVCPAGNFASQAARPEGPAAVVPYSGADLHASPQVRPAGISFALIEDNFINGMPSLVVDQAFWDAVRSEICAQDPASPVCLDVPANAQAGFHGGQLSNVQNLSHPTLSDGQAVTYTLRVANRGQGAAGAVQLDIRSHGQVRLTDPGAQCTTQASGEACTLHLNGSVAPGKEQLFTFHGLVDLGFDAQHSYGWAGQTVTLYDETSSKEIPLDWVVFAHRLERMLPSYLELQTPTALVGPAKNTLQGIALDEVPVPIVRMEVTDPHGDVTTSDCPQDSASGSHWACSLDAGQAQEGEQFSLRLAGIDARGRAGTWYPQQPLTVDAIPPTITLGTDTLAALSSGYLGEAVKSFQGTLQDNHLIQAVEVCRVSGSQELCTRSQAALAPGATQPRRMTVTDQPAAPLSLANSGCSGGQALVRTFDVSQDVTVRSLQVGLNIDHPARGNLRAVLTAPSGVTTTLLDFEWASWMQNYDVLLDDAAGLLATDDTKNHVTAAPYYENMRHPNGWLYIFNGQPAQGKWTLSICDVYPLGAGAYNRAQLVLVTDDPLAPTQGSWQQSFSIPAGTAHQPLQLRLYGVDSVGNRSQAQTYQVILDNVPPLITVTRSSAVALRYPRLDMAGRVSDASGVKAMLLKYRAASGAIRTEKITVKKDGSWSFSGQLALPAQGSFSAWVEAQDAAGNRRTVGPLRISLRLPGKVYLPLIQRFTQVEAGPASQASLPANLPMPSNVTGSNSTGR